MKNKSPELSPHVWGIVFPPFQHHLYTTVILSLFFWWVSIRSLLGLAMGLEPSELLVEPFVTFLGRELTWQESWFSEFTHHHLVNFLHDLNGMEQKLLEPPYKSQWQYKVLDLNTQKTNDQVGIQHAYIIRFLQLKKKHIQSYAEHLVKSPLQMVGLKLMYQPCPSAKTECPKRSPAPLATGTRPRSWTWWAPQPQGHLQCCMIYIFYLIPPPNPSNSSILRRPTREILAAFHWVLVPPTRLVSAKVANVPGWGVQPRVSMCWSPCVSATNGIL